MELKEGMPIAFGPVKGMIFGGPFRHYQQGQRRLVGVKMAAEIKHHHDLAVDTEDFSVPSVDDMKIGVLFGINALFSGKDVYAGCMGGTGRTGTYMGCMAKAMQDYHAAYPLIKTSALLKDNLNPVSYVRRHYRSHAIETKAQEAFVRNFDTKEAVALIHTLSNPQVVVKEVTVYVDREKPVFLGPIAWAQHKFWSWVENKNSPKR